MGVESGGVQENSCRQACAITPGFQNGCLRAPGRGTIGRCQTACKAVPLVSEKQDIAINQCRTACLQGRG
eukprot:483662-Pelagomonas_calceolata.AAC.1